MIMEINPNANNGIGTGHTSTSTSATTMTAMHITSTAVSASSLEITGNIVSPPLIPSVSNSITNAFEALFKTPTSATNIPISTASSTAIASEVTLPSSIAEPITSPTLSQMHFEDMKKAEGRAIQQNSVTVGQQQQSKEKTSKIDFRRLATACEEVIILNSTSK